MVKKSIVLFCVICLLSVCSLTTFAEDPKDNEYDQSELLSTDVYAECDVRAKAFALMDVNTGTLLAAGNEHARLYPASVTKIMTILLTVEEIEAGKLSLDKVLTCSDTAANKGGSQIWLEAGEEMSVDELLRAAVIYSANDACALLAETVGGSEKGFVKLMNKKAKELGMNDTVFDNCTGLDDDTTKHLSSAYDIALMSCELLKHDMIKKYTTVWMDSLRQGKTQLVNTNRLIRYYSGATGLKTGTTSKAGCCVSASAERDGMELVAVILGAENSNDRFNGARTLLDHGFASYEIYTPEADRKMLGNITVSHGVKAFLKIECEKTEDILINKGSKDNIKQKVDLPDKLEAPITKGQKIGTVSFSADGKTIAEYDVKAVENVEKMDFLHALYTIMKSAGDN